MKTTSQTRRNGSAARAPKQAATQPIEFTDSSQILMIAQPARADMLWASDKGELFLHTGGLKENPRPLNLIQAREWWLSSCPEKHDVEPPVYPEESDACKFIHMGHESGQRAKQSPNSNTQNLEEAINRSVALLNLLQEFICSPESAGVGPALKGAFDSGLIVMVSNTNRDLLSAFYGRNGGAQ